MTVGSIGPMIDAFIVHGEIAGHCDDSPATHASCT